MEVRIDEGKFLVYFNGEILSYKQTYNPKLIDKFITAIKGFLEQNNLRTLIIDLSKVRCIRTLDKFISKLLSNIK